MKDSQIKTEIYRNVSSMEPLLPEASRLVLADLTIQITREAGRLGAGMPVETKCSIEKVVQQMNSYYSNLIEGHRTNPREVAQALEHHYARDPKKKALQQLGVAHIETEQHVRNMLSENPTLNVYSPDFICQIHQEFYDRLSGELRTIKDASGREYPLTPGVLRTFNVDVGSHTPPDHQNLGQFMDRFDSFYSSDRIIATRRLIAIAASHHRLLWIHPFGDGNGRVARLHSHAALVQCQLNGYGLWTLARGLARKQKDYFMYLELADQQRENDYDGRGNLSAKHLASFCQFFMEAILDQITFMSSVLDYKGLKHRIENYIYREDVFGKHNDQGKYLIFEALTEGRYPRGDATRLTGYKETSARELLQTALQRKLLVSDGPRSPVRLGLPSDVLEDYFPKLFLPSD